ncbi:RNA polymerase sigma factor [Arenimonas sp.]|nr:RNA polymerase sigma factor [Candidatus Parcubacteria bacterium]
MHDIKDKTDNELVILVRQNPEHLSHIIDRYRIKLERYIDRRTNVNNHDKEDILQDVFIKIYRNINDYDDSLIFSSWIYRITHNYIIDWHRKNKKHIGISIDDEESKLIYILQDENLTPDNQEICDQENLERIKKEIKKLSQEYQEILILKFFEDKSYEEISDILKISTNSVGVKINRAKKLLKEKIYV